MSDTPRREVDERLADWVDGRMSERERDRFLGELRVNAQLQRDLEQYERTVGTVRAALRAPAAPSPMADRVLRALADGHRAPAPERTGWTWRHVRWSLACAAALLACAWWIDGWSRHEPDTVPVARLDDTRAFTLDAVEEQAATTDPAGWRAIEAAPNKVAPEAPPPVPQAMPTLKKELAATDKAAAEQDRRFASGQVGEVAKPPTPDTFAEGAKDREAERFAQFRRAEQGRASNPGGALGGGGVAPAAPATGAASGPATAGPAGPAGPATGGPGARPGDGKNVDKPLETRASEPAAEGADGTLLRLRVAGESTPEKLAEKPVEKSAYKPSDTLAGKQGAAASDNKPGAALGAATPGTPAPDAAAPAAPGADAQKRGEPVLAFVLLEGEVAVARKEGAGRGASKSAPQPQPEGARNDHKSDETESKARGAAKGEAADQFGVARQVPLDAAGLRLHVDQFLAAAVDTTVEPAALRWVTKAGTVDVSPWLGEVQEVLDRGGAAHRELSDFEKAKSKDVDRDKSDKKDAKPAAVERTWLVEGSKDDVQAVLARVGTFADARRLTMRTGEIPAPADALREGRLAADDERKANESAGAGASTYGTAGRAGERTRVVLRLRLHPR